MKVKVYLMQAMYLGKNAVRYMEESETIRSRLTSTAAPATDNINVQHSASDQMADSISKLLEYEDLAIRESEKCHSKRIEIMAQIDGMEDQRLAEILRMRYIDEKKLSQIAKETGYDYDYVCKLHGYALKAFDEKYKISEFVQ